MAYEIFQLPKVTPLTLGVVMPGAKLYFYATGTTTPQNTYTDSALTTPSANPVVADSAGVFAAIYLDPTLVYKVTLKTSADVTIYTIDPCNDQLLTAASIGLLLYPRNAAEISVAVTPVDYTYPYGHVHRYGAVGNGSSDDRQAWQTAADVMEAAGGGVVTCIPGSTYRLVCGSTTYLTIQYCLKLNEGVTVDARRASLNLECGSGNQMGIWLSNSSVGIANAIISLTSSGSPSSQGFFHCCVGIGLPNNMGDDPNNPDAAQFMSNFFVRGCTFYNTGLRRPAIGCIGGPNTGIIEDNYVPTSTTICGLVAMDWGNTGTVSSSAIATTKTSFLAGGCYTTHPNNIVIRNNRCGFLSAPVSGDLGAFGVRVSAVYNVIVENLRIESCELAGYFHTGGDLGFEFARDQDKRQAYHGNACRNMTICNASSTMAMGVFLDTLADNVYREQFISGYVPISNPLWPGDVTVEDCSIVGGNTDTTYGVRIIQGKGIIVRNNAVSRWTYGILVDEFTDDTSIEVNTVTNCRGNGITIGLQQLREGTTGVKVLRNTVYGNGTDVTSPGIRVFRGKNVLVDSNILGSTAEATQSFGIAVSDISGAISDIKIENNHCLGASNTAYGITGSSPQDALKYRAVACFRNNTVEYGVTSILGGQTYIPLNALLIGQQRLREWLNPSTSAPTDGTWYRGDKIWQSLEPAAGVLGHSVTTSGTFGTLASITNGSTTNGSPTFTCSLTGITVNTTISTYSVVVSSATGLRAGMKCSISAAGITDAYILDVSGTTLQLDTQANATQSGGAFTTSGLVEGEVISVNTTTPVAGAIILKIAGSSVTIDTNFANTQSGRTVTYTTPIFKAWAAIAA